MDRGILYSGVGHVGLVLWALFGGAFLSPRELPEMTVTSVSLMSSAEFDAMAAAVPATPEPAPATAEPVEPTPDAPEPAVAESNETPPPEPAASDLPALPAIPEPPPLPQADIEQPLPSVTNSVRPLPRPAPRVAPLPAEAPPPEAEVADEVVPEVAPDATAVAPVVEEDRPAAAPEEATSQIITEAVETDDSSELAPVSTNRPRARPAQVAAAADAPEPEAEPVDTVVEETPAEEPTETDADAVTAALAAAMAETPAEEPATTSDTAGAEAPTGPPMTSGEKDALRVAVQRCWNVGALSSDALRVTVTVAVSLSQGGQPDAASIQMLGYEGGSETAARQAYEAARRAVIRCGSDGFDLPVEKYAQWQNLELVFNPEGMRMK